MVGVEEESPANDAAGSDGPAAKRVAVGHATALAGLTLQVVMHFAGKNEGIFIANVCKSWKKSYTSTFGGCITTHHASVMMNLHRIRWSWSDWFTGLSPGRENSSWYVGKHAPRSVVEEVMLDNFITLDRGFLIKGIVASGRVKLLRELWESHIVAPSRAQGSGSKLNKRICELGDEASKYGHLQVLAMLWSRLDEKHAETFCFLSATTAACRGQVHILEFLSMTDTWREDGGPGSLTRLAAVHSQLGALRWLLAHGHTLATDSCTALASAVSSKVSTFDFLLENECPKMEGEFVSCCVQHERLDALQWCYDTLRVRRPYVWNEDHLKGYMLLAGTCDKRASVKFLLEHGAVWPDIGAAFGTYISSYDFQDPTIKCMWSVPFLEWAMTQGCTLDTWTVTTCARLTTETDWDNPQDCALLETVAWVHSHGRPCGCPEDVPDF